MCKYDFFNVNNNKASLKNRRISVGRPIVHFKCRSQELPVYPSPEVFGLHINSGIIRDLQSTSQLCDSFLSVMESGGGTDDAEAMDNLLIAIASDVLAKLPENFDVETASAKYPVMYTESMNTVLVQEMERFNVLLAVIRRSLQNLIKAIKGAIVMTPELEAIAQSLSIAKYPAFWSKYSYPSLKSLAGYITNFIERLHFLQVIMRGYLQKFRILCTKGRGIRRG